MRLKPTWAKEGNPKQTTPQKFLSDVSNLVQEYNTWVRKDETYESNSLKPGLDCFHG